MLRRFFDHLGYLTFMALGNAYIAAASLIGFETLAVILGYATIWPIGAPLMVVGIGIYVLVRRRITRREEDDAVQ